MKLTSDMLKKIIEEEAKKFGAEKDVESVKAKEVDADEYADSLEKKIDYMKALKIEESRLRRRWRKIQEQKKLTLESITKKL